MIIDLPPLLFLPQKIAFRQDLYMPGNGLSRGFKGSGNGPWGHGIRGHHRQDGPPTGVGNGLKDIPSQFHTCSYMTANIYAVIQLRKFSLKKIPYLKM